MAIIYFNMYNTYMRNKKKLCIPESFNTNISHQFYDYKITYVNTKGDLYKKNGFKRLFYKFLKCKTKSESKTSIIFLFDFPRPQMKHKRVSSP